MKSKKIIFSVCCLFLVLFLFYVNVGLNVSGPAHFNAKKDEVVLEKVNKRFPLIHSLYRHSFKYVTYSAILNDKVYIFDYEGGFVIEKEFDESMIFEIQAIVQKQYGIEKADVHIGYGYDNVVFVVEQENKFIYFDYDTKEVVFYSRGDLI